MPEVALGALPLRFDSLLIGGAWRPARDQQVLEMPDPADGGVFAEVSAGSAADVDDAVTAAAQALTGPWSRLSPTQRGTLLHKLADLLAARAGELAVLESADTGRPLRDIRTEVARVADWLHFFAGGADRATGTAMELGPDMAGYTIRQPVGVVGAIIPSNSPLNLCCWKLGPALAAGNTMVIKPSEVAGVSLLELGRLVGQAGFPDGVVNIVTGTGAAVGSALVKHPAVKKISFTGGITTARAIMRDSADDLKRLTLECGGKSPNIVFADADLESALNMAVFASFKSAGQSCSLGSRLLVEDAIHDEFVGELVCRTAGVRVGHPLDERTHIGPQASQGQLDKTHRYIEAGRQSAVLRFGGGRPDGDGLGHGFYVQPTIFTEVDPHSAIAQEEIFGPVLSVIRFSGEEEAVKIANATPYGLTAAVWTRDFGKAQRMVRQVEAGLVTINCYRPVSWMLPYGGMKLSGLGRENGIDAILDYTENKTVAYYHGSDPLPDPFALEVPPRPLPRRPRALPAARPARPATTRLHRPGRPLKNIDHAGHNRVFGVRGILPFHGINPCSQQGYLPRNGNTPRSRGASACRTPRLNVSGARHTERHGTHNHCCLWPAAQDTGQCLLATPSVEWRVSGQRH